MKRHDLSQGFFITFYNEENQTRETAIVVGPGVAIELDNASLQHLRAIMTATKELTHYIAIGPNCWGRAETQSQAIKLMSQNASGGKRPRHYSIYQVTRNTVVNDMDVFTRPGYDAEPVKVFSTQGLDK